MVAIDRVRTQPFTEQRFVLPGQYDWQHFKQLNAIFETTSGLRVFYLDGQIELMTVGEAHEIYSSTIAMLLVLYFVRHQIEFVPVGCATRESEPDRVSFQPDQSYYIGDRKTHPNLAIEVIVTSGNSKKLEKYKRLGIEEVWFWQAGALSVYVLTEEGYQQRDRSYILPDLDVATFVRCVNMPSKLEAATAFQTSLQ